MYIFVLQVFGTQFNFCVHTHLKTVDDFHGTYDREYGNQNMNTNSTDDQTDEDENLILRSFTDDPDIPLRQIKVKNTSTCELELHDLKRTV